METADALKAFIAGEELPEHGAITSQSGALYVDEWWPAAVRITASSFLVRTNEDGPIPEISEQMATLLEEQGLRNLGDENDWPILEVITLQWLAVVGASWNVWSLNAEEAEAAIGAKVMDQDPAPKLL
ncbi:MAG: hypothetical protein ACR2M4_07920 [Actinomycetota bacterium]